MENVVLIVMQKNEDVFNLFYELKEKPFSQHEYSVYQAALFHKSDDLLQCKDAFSQTKKGVTLLEGGLLGATIGLLLGPVGMLIGSVVGLTIAELRVARKILAVSALFEFLNKDVQPGEYCLMLHAEEAEALPLNSVFAGYSIKRVERKPAMEVYEEIMLADETHQQETAATSYQDERKSAGGPPTPEQQTMEARAKEKAQHLADSVQSTYPRMGEDKPGAEPSPQNTAAELPLSCPLSCPLPFAEKEPKPKISSSSHRPTTPS